MPTEQVECLRCGGLPGLVQNCPNCEGRGVIEREVDLGHRTLSQIRSSNGPDRDPGRYGDGGAVGPREVKPIAEVTESNAPHKAPSRANVPGSKPAATE